jgi:Dolichyl-phosphate-mannose-protein mannosyltransferase
MQASSRRAYLATALAIGLLAGGLRFYRLGAYPFGNDETATLREADSFFRGPLPQENRPAATELADQIDRLPRLVPLGYAVLEVGYRLVGTDEFGSRSTMALLGTLSAVVVFLGLAGPLGTPGAVAAALLVAFWPEHLFHSQNNRFYMTAGFCAVVCMIAGSRAVARNSAGAIVLACLAALAAIAAHTLQGVLIGGLSCALVAAALVGRRPLPWGQLGIVTVTGLLALAVLVLYLLPVARGWNQGELWGYGIRQSLQGAVAQLGWPTVLLAVPGGLALWHRRPAQAGYWLTFAGLWLAAGIVFPLTIVYYTFYVFPLAFAVVVLAGCGLGAVYEALRPQGRLLAGAAVAAGCLLNLPSVYSHYQDGGRHDYRTPAHFVEQHWQPGDRLASVSSDILGYYSPLCREQVFGLNGTDPLPQLEMLAQTPGRLWIVLSSGRSGHPAEVGAWLARHCSRELLVRKKRLDYYDYAVEVFLHPVCPP